MTRHLFTDIACHMTPEGVTHGSVTTGIVAHVSVTVSHGKVTVTNDSADVTRGSVIIGIVTSCSMKYVSATPVVSGLTYKQERLVKY